MFRATRRTGTGEKSQVCSAPYPPAHSAQHQIGIMLSDQDRVKTKMLREDFSLKRPSDVEDPCRTAAKHRPDRHARTPAFRHPLSNGHQSPGDLLLDRPTATFVNEIQT